MKIWCSLFSLFIYVFYLTIFFQGSLAISKCTSISVAPATSFNSAKMKTFRKHLSGDLATLTKSVLSSILLPEYSNLIKVDKGEKPSFTYLRFIFMCE